MEKIISHTGQAAIWAYIAESRPQIESALRRYLPVSQLPVENRFDKALHYALFPGGKRLRPVLTMLGAEVVGGDAASEKVMAAATAIEFVHSSSLVFDDLPSMDDAQERRGKPALHLVYGEGVAILVAIALLNASQRLLLNGDSGDLRMALSAGCEMIDCIEKQVRGQILDIAENSLRDFFAEQREFETLRNLKATALIQVSLRLGAIFSGAAPRQVESLTAFAELLGDAYQISDDITDVTQDHVLIDGGRHATYAATWGKESANHQVLALAAQAKELLRSKFDDNRAVGLLCEMADYIAKRSA